MEGYIQLTKGYRDETDPEVEKRCEVNYPLPKVGEEVIAIFEDYRFKIKNRGSNMCVVVENYLDKRNVFRAKYVLDDDNGMSGYFSPCPFYREVFAICLTISPEVDSDY